MIERRYRYLGDRMTDPQLVGKLCTAVYGERGQCIRGRGNMLVWFDGEPAPRVVVARRLRRLVPSMCEANNT